MAEVAGKEGSAALGRYLGEMQDMECALGMWDELGEEKSKWTEPEGTLQPGAEIADGSPPHSVHHQHDCVLGLTSPLARGEAGL
jgi:hypothetical protein